MLFRGISPDSDAFKLRMLRGTSSQSEALKAGLARGELILDLLPSSLVGGPDAIVSCTDLAVLRGATLVLVEKSWIFPFSHVVITE